MVINGVAIKKGMVRVITVSFNNKSNKNRCINLNALYENSFVNDIAE